MPSPRLAATVVLCLLTLLVALAAIVVEVERSGHVGGDAAEHTH